MTIGPGSIGTCRSSPGSEEFRLPENDAPAMSRLADIFSYSATFAAIAFALFLLARFRDARLSIPLGFAFALYLGIDDLLTALGGQAGLAFVGGNWNWSGKLYSLALAIGMLLVFRIPREAAGLVWPRRNTGSSLVATLSLIALSATLGAVFRPDAPDAETLAFQLTMPGIVEELVYRGVAPALFLGLVAGRREASASPWPAILATAVMFSLWHGLGLRGGEFGFEWIPAAYTLVGGLAYGWLRFHSGSLLWPVIAHAGGNVIFLLVPMVI